MKKALEIILAVLLVAACIGTYFIRTTKDTEPPKITAGATPTYHFSDDWSVLLTGVTAVDDKDGDVASTLMVERVTYTKENTLAIVTYVAKDDSNNVSKLDVEIPVLPEENPIPVEPVPDENQTPAE